MWRRRIALLLLSLVTTAVGSVWGWRCGRIYERNLNPPLGYQSRARKLYLAMRESLGLVRYHSHGSQDRWISEFVYPDLRDGFFVDVGSGDGVWQSNSKRLEDLGWKGICIDPFPTNMDGRNCKVFREVVFSESGKKVAFRDAGFLGGIDSLVDTGRVATANAPLVEFQTTTLDDILARAGAPRFIHYMSIDVEGAELEVLRGLSLSKHRVGAFTIEHNLEEPKRTEIRKLLESHGYRFAMQLPRDDCYLLNAQ